MKNETPASDEFVQISREGPIYIITLNRPERLNALNGDMFLQLEMTFDEADCDKSVCAIVFRTEGKGFCAGARLHFVADGRTASCLYSGEYRLLCDMG